MFQVFPYRSLLVEGLWVLLALANTEIDGVDDALRPPFVDRDPFVHV